MTKQQLPAVSLLTPDTLEEFKTADKVVLVAYIDKDDKASNQTYTATAESLRDEYIFGATSDAALADAEGVKQPAIVLYKDFDEGKNTFEKSFDVDAIAKFAKTASTPLVGEIGPDTYAGYMTVRITTALADRGTPDPGLTADSPPFGRLVFPLHTSSPKRQKSALNWQPRSNRWQRNTRAR